MKHFLVLLCLCVSVCVADKPVNPTYTSASSSNDESIIGTVSKVSLPSKTKAIQPKSDSYGSPQPDTYAAPAAAETPGDVGTQGYYYYYYPVGNSNQAPSYSNHNVESYSAQESGLSSFLNGKIILILLILGGLIILAVAGSAINLGNGRSLTDLTDYAYNNIDDITNLVVQAIEIYSSK